MWLWIVGGIVVSLGFVAFTGAPYVPSKRRDIRQAFTELYPLSKKDTLVDIGSGDGVVLRQARHFGARAVGYEIHPLLVAVSRWLSRHDDGVTVHMKSFWHAKLPTETTVVYTFGDSRDIARMYGVVESEATRLQRPLFLISYGFAMKDHDPVRQVGAYYLYKIKPLQGQSPHV